MGNNTLYSGVSDDYKKAIKADVRKVRMRLRVTLSNGSIFTVSDSGILKGSLYVDWRLVSNDDFEIGNLYAAELGVQLFWNDNPYILREATIEPYFWLYIAKTGLYEEVPLGRFNVSEIERHKNYVGIKALDDLTKMSYDYMTTWCTKSNDHYIMKGMSIGQMIIDILDLYSIPYDHDLYTVEHINTMAGSGEHFTNVQFEDRDSIPTYRNLLECAMQLMGGNGIMNRNGSFDLVKYSTEPDMTITPYDRFSLSYSDHEVKNMTFCYDDSKYGDGNYPIHLDDNFLFADLGDNKIHNWLQSIYGQSKGLSYVPCTIEYPGDPSIELGQMITVEPIISTIGMNTFGDLDGKLFSALDGTKFGRTSDYLCQPFNTVVMHHHWVYRGKSTIHSYGKDWLLRGIYKRK